MKKIEATIPLDKLVDVRSALKDEGTMDIQSSEVKVFGEKDNVGQEMYRGTAYDVDFKPKCKLEIYGIRDETVDAVIDIIKRVACEKLEKTPNVNGCLIAVFDMSSIVRLGVSKTVSKTLSRAT